MTWWMWVLLFLLIFIVAAVFLGALLLGLWRRMRELFRDLGTAAERLSAVSEELERLQNRTAEAAEDPAVFASPTRLRAERFGRRTKPKGSGRRTGT